MRPARPRLILLGSPRLVGTQAAHPLAARDAVLLAWLLLDGPTSRHQMAALLWPEADAGRRAGNLRQRIYRLRHLAGEPVVEGDTVLALSERIDADLAQPGDPRSGDDPASGELLAGIRLQDADEAMAWLHRARDRVRARLREDLSTRADRLEQSGAHADALRIADRLLDLDPLDDVTHRRVMRLHYLAGDLVAARLAYRRYAARLKAELDAQPTAATQELNALVERAEATTPGALAASLDDAFAVATRRPPRLVGREKDLLAVARAIDGGQAVLLLGAPGIGKTRLLQDLAATRARCLVVGARPGDAHQPYAIVQRLLHETLRLGAGRVALAAADASLRSELARLVPQAGAPPAHAAAPERLAWACGAFIEAVTAMADGPAVLLVDDVQFADRASQELLVRWIGQRAPAAVGWVLAAREAELPPLLRDGLAAGAPEAGTPPQAAAQAHATTTVTLGALDLASTSELLVSLGGDFADRSAHVEAWAGALVRHGGGNPMFILQSVRELHLDRERRPLAREPSSQAALPLPKGVAALIAQRLGTLTTAARSLAHVAAVAGEDFDAELATVVLGLRPTDLAAPWAELQAAGMFEGERFAHDLMTEAVSAALAEPLRRLLCAEVADFLQGRADGSERVAALWWAARRHAEAARAYQRAAARARSRHAPVEEAYALRRAIQALEAVDLSASATPADGLPGAFDLHLQLFEAASYCEPIDVRETLAQRLAELASRPREHTVASLALAVSCNQHDRFAERQRHAEAARAGAGEPTDEALRFVAASVLAVALTRQGAADDARRCLERHELLVLPQGEMTVLVRDALCSVAQTLIHMDLDQEAFDFLGPVLRLARDRQDAALESLVQFMRSWAQWRLGRLHDAIASAESSVAVALRSGMVHEQLGHAGQAGMHRARLYKEAGRFADALSVLESLLDVQAASDDAEPTNPAIRFELAVVWWRLGQRARGQSVLRKPPPTAVPSVRAGWLLTRARVVASSPAESRQLLDEALEMMPCEGGNYYWATLRAARTVYLAPDEAAAECEALADLIERQHLRMWEVPILSLWCDALVRAGRVAPAVRKAGELVARLGQAAPVVMYAPEGWWNASRAFSLAADDAQARAAWARAHDWIVGTALPHVPPPFRTGFLGNPVVNAAVMDAARRFGSPASGR